MKQALEKINMIIWINGSFGVGKTTVSEKLKDKIEGSVIYDPEDIGSFLSKTLPIKKNDFQDFELWRTLNFEILKYLDEKLKVVIVPMTITNKRYYDEIVGRLKENGVEARHFILTASKESIINRLNIRGNSTEWAYRQVDRCIEAIEKNRFDGYKIDTDDKDPDEVCSIIIRSITR